MDQDTLQKHLDDYAKLLQKSGTPRSLGFATNKLGEIEKWLSKTYEKADKGKDKESSDI